MEVVTLYFLSDDGERFEDTFEFATSDWYHKPAILRCMAWFFQFTIKKDFNPLPF